MITGINTRNTDSMRHSWFWQLCNETSWMYGNICLSCQFFPSKILVHYVVIYVLVCVDHRVIVGPFHKCYCIRKRVDEVSKEQCNVKYLVHIRHQPWWCDNRKQYTQVLKQAILTDKLNYGEYLQPWNQSNSFYHTQESQTSKQSIFGIPYLLHLLLHFRSLQERPHTRRLTNQQLHTQFQFHVP